MAGALQLRAELRHWQGKRCQSLQVRNCWLSTHELFAQPTGACAGSDPFYSAPLTLPEAPDFPAWPPPSVPQGRSPCWCSPCPTVPSLPTPDKSSSAAAPQPCRSAPAARHRELSGPSGTTTLPRASSPATSTIPAHEGRGTSDIERKKNKPKAQHSRHALGIYRIGRSIPTCRAPLEKTPFKNRTQKKPLLFSDGKKCPKNNCSPTGRTFGCCQSQELSILGACLQARHQLGKKIQPNKRKQPNLSFNSKEIFTYFKRFFPMNHL